MANLFRHNPLAFALATIASLLVVVIALEATFGIWRPTPPPAPTTPTASDVKMLPPLAAIVPDQAYPETAARPLFTPTRRPAPAAPTVASTMQKGQFTLTGVLALGTQRTALLRETKGGKVHRVEVGREINGMTLSAADGDKVTLSQGGDQEVLTLQVQKGPASPAGVAAAPTGGPFGPTAGPAPGQIAGGPAPVATPPAGAPQPAVPTGVPTPAPPAVTAQPSTPAANPAQRSGFGPFQPGTPPNPTEATTPMTPEELLARRRARRGQQQPNQ